MPLNQEIIRAICFDMDGTLSDSDDVMVARFSRLLKPFHFLFPRRQTTRIARRIVMAIEAPANFLMGIPDIFGLDEPLAWLIDLIYRKVGHKPKKSLFARAWREGNACRTQQNAIRWRSSVLAMLVRPMPSLSNLDCCLISSALPPPRPAGTPSRSPTRSFGLRRKWECPRKPA